MNSVNQYICLLTCLNEHQHRLKKSVMSELCWTSNNWKKAGRMKLPAKYTNDLTSANCLSGCMTKGGNEVRQHWAARLIPEWVTSRWRTGCQDNSAHAGFGYSDWEGWRYGYSLSFSVVITVAFCYLVTLQYHISWVLLIVATTLFTSWSS